jgi:16S rRNA (uracil1498-N3)-methyltransferase
VVERGDSAAVASFFTNVSLAANDHIALEDSVAQHARVRRLEPGNTVRLLDGRGRVAWSELLALTKREVTVRIQRLVEVAKPIGLEIIVPIADRDRMLMAAEKCVELQVTSWRPVYFARSRSVSPRGEGDRFREKVIARMRSALEQSGGAWLPDVHVDAEASEVMRSLPPEWNRLLLDASGSPILGLVSNKPTAIAVGPEGGMEQHEVAAAESSGWRVASLGPTTLRFETAVIAGAAVVRATQPVQEAP